jgi:hypothetical protein
MGRVVNVNVFCDAPEKNISDALPRWLFVVDILERGEYIVEREKWELEAVVRTRKERLSGKRKVVNGKHLVSVPELQEE